MRRRPAGLRQPGAELDEFVLITHSLGSRATLDAMQRLTNIPVDFRSAAQADGRHSSRAATSRCSCCPTSCRCSRPGARASRWWARSAAYCGPSATKPGRFFGKTEIIAFSDPNDLMSYPVPDKFADKYIESGCARASPTSPSTWSPVNSLLGPGRRRQPAQRASGLRRRRAGRRPCWPTVPATRTWHRSWPSRCTWRETDESLMH